MDLSGKDRMGTVFAGNDKAAPDGNPDNYDRYRYGCSDSDGEGCDAEWSADYDVLFADGVFGCTATRMITISCEWDADGEMSGYRKTRITTVSLAPLSLDAIDCRRTECHFHRGRQSGLANADLVRRSRSDCRGHQRLRQVHGELGVSLIPS